MQIACRGSPSNTAARQQAYRGLVAQAIDPAETDTIRRHLLHQLAYGPDRFRRMIEQQLGSAAQESARQKHRPNKEIRL